MDNWIGVDLDGCLAFDNGWGSFIPFAIGEPVPAMLERVKNWLSAGTEVRIVTARVSTDNSDFMLQRQAVGDWCEKYLGERLRVTCEKGPRMIELWDDRAIQVIKNTGVRADGQ